MSAVSGKQVDNLCPEEDWKYKALNHCMDRAILLQTPWHYFILHPTITTTVLWTHCPDHVYSKVLRQSFSLMRHWVIRLKFFSPETTQPIFFHLVLLILLYSSKLNFLLTG